jgi:hypothetical protein
MKFKNVEDIMKRGLEGWAEELDGDAKTDKFGLDNECAVQTGLYAKWALLSTLASRERDWRQKELEERNALLDNDIRSDPGNYGISDIKENAVKAVIAKDDGIMKLKAGVIEATAYAKFFDRAVSACDQKKMMLRELGDLWLGEYYSDVQIKKGEAEDGMREKMRGRRTGRK